jgi:quercetin dioxygenase-like cupin family protein
LRSDKIFLGLIPGRELKSKVMRKRKPKWIKIENASLSMVQQLLAAETTEHDGQGSETVNSVMSPFSRYRVEKWYQAYPPNPAMLRHILVAESYAVFQWCDKPGSTYAWHKHDEDQSHWIVSGSLELSIEGCGPVVLGPGDRDFMPAGTYHSARVIGTDPVIYLVGALNS